MAWNCRASGYRVIYALTRVNRSRADILLSSEIPWGSTKWAVVRPNSCAWRFILSTNEVTLPEMCSARATQASLPDATVIPWISWSTLTVVPTSTNILEPSVRQASSEMLTSPSNASLPWEISSKTMYRVMILVRLAGTWGVSTSLAMNTLPVLRSASK